MKPVLFALLIAIQPAVASAAGGWCLILEGPFNSGPVIEAVPARYPTKVACQAAGNVAKAALSGIQYVCIPVP